MPTSPTGTLKNRPTNGIHAIVNKKTTLLNLLGPGILFACVAVGGANFIQSAHAGAEYGFKLIPFVLLVYFIKYPFFEFAQRYCLATQETLLHGYNKVGRWTLFIYILLVSCSAFPTIAVLSLITSNVTGYFFDATISPLVISIALLSICTLILTLGRYQWLTSTIKIIMALLVICSLISVLIAMPEAHHVLATAPKIDLLTEFTFLVALMGWMPASMEVSVWTTLWTKAKARNDRRFPTLAQGLFDFKFGYALSAVLIIIFISLAALVMYSSNQSFSRTGFIFIEQLITLFTSQIGHWGQPFIATVIFSVLFSTTLTCLDAYPRAVTTAITLIQPKTKSHTEIIYWLSIIILFLSSILLSGYFLKSMQELVQIATVLAFLTAPIFGYLNYKVVKKLQPSQLPPKFLLLLGKIGLLFLVMTSVLFIYLMINY